MKIGTATDIKRAKEFVSLWKNKDLPLTIAQSYYTRFFSSIWRAKHSSATPTYIRQEIQQFEYERAEIERAIGGQENDSK